MRAGFQSDKFPEEEMCKANVKHEGFTATQGCLLCEKATQVPFLRGNTTLEVPESCCLNLTFLYHGVSCSPGWSQTYCLLKLALNSRVSCFCFPCIGITLCVSPWPAYFYFFWLAFLFTQSLLCSHDRARTDETPPTLAS